MLLHERKWKENHWALQHSPFVAVIYHTRVCDDSNVQSNEQKKKKQRSYVNGN